MSEHSYLLIPSTERGNGTGHLVRCAQLAKAIGKEATLYLPKDDDTEKRGYSSLRDTLPELFKGIAVTHDPEYAAEVVVLDVREASKARVKALAERGRVIGLDLSGDGRNEAHYLIDMLNRKVADDEMGANLIDPGYLDLPNRTRDFPRTFKRILITFGGEDPKGLTEKTILALSQEQLFPPEMIDVIPGTLSGVTEVLSASGVNILDRIPDLKERLAEWDVVITQYGLTAYEALAAGCAVLLINPSEYHTALGVAAGFPQAGTMTADPESIRKILKNPESLELALRKIGPLNKRSLAETIRALDFADSGKCPLCHGSASSVVSRHPQKTYRKCRDCKIVYRDDHAGKKKEYGVDYFFDEYKKQYGKTYLEDFGHLMQLAKSRIDRLSSVGRFSGGESVLDIGCAYGAFLSAALKAGLKPMGIDVSENAVKYVREVLKLEALVEEFPAYGVERFGNAKFDAVTLWYVIEHVSDLDAVLRELAGMVKPGGVLAFSTPSGSGISARFRTEAFYAASPDDHRVILSPGAMRAMLAKYGFRLKKTVITGHHPERVKFFEERIRGGRHALGMFASRLFRLGDTFEAYAVKE